MAKTTPTCPKHLTGDARTQWRRLCLLMQSTNGLTDADLLLIELAADAYKRWRRAAKDGTTAEVHTCQSDYLRCLADLKLTRRGTAPKTMPVPTDEPTPEPATTAPAVDLKKYRGRLRVVG